MENGHSCKINNLSVNIENIFLFLSSTLLAPQPASHSVSHSLSWCIRNRKIICRLLRWLQTTAGTPESAAGPVELCWSESDPGLRGGELSAALASLSPARRAGCSSAHESPGSVTLTRAVGPALSTVSKDSLSGEGYSLQAASVPLALPPGLAGLGVVASCGAVLWHVWIPCGGHRFSSAGAACSAGLQLSSQRPQEVGAGWGVRSQESGAPGLSAGGVRGSWAFTCAVFHVKALLPVLYHTAQLPPCVIIPTTRQGCPTVNSALTLSTWWQHPIPAT